MQINVNRDGMPKTLLGDQCPAVWNTRISYQLTWLSGLNIFLSINAVLGNALILVAPSKMLLRCLSTTDLLVGLLSQPMYAAYEMSLLNGSLGRCRLTFFISFIAGYIWSGVSLFTSTAISLSALLRHSEESAAASFKRHYTVTLVFTNSTLTPVYPFLDDQGSSKSCQRNNQKSSEYSVKTQRCTIHKQKARREEGCYGNVCTLPRAAKVCLLATSVQKK